MCPYLQYLEPSHEHCPLLDARTAGLCSVPPCCWSCSAADRSCFCPSDTSMSVYEGSRPLTSENRLPRWFPGVWRSSLCTAKIASKCNILVFAMPWKGRFLLGLGAFWRERSFLLTRSDTFVVHKWPSDSFPKPIPCQEVGSNWDSSRQNVNFGTYIQEHISASDTSSLRSLS